MVGFVDVELVSGTAGFSRVVVNSDDEVVGAIVIEWRVENNLIPSLHKIECARIDWGQVFKCEGIDGVVKFVDSGVGKIDGAVAFG